MNLTKNQITKSVITICGQTFFFFFRIRIENIIVGLLYCTNNVITFDNLLRSMSINISKYIFIVNILKHNIYIAVTIRCILNILVFGIKYNMIIYDRIFKRITNRCIINVLDKQVYLYNSQWKSEISEFDGGPPTTVGTEKRVRIL